MFTKHRKTKVILALTAALMLAPPTTNALASFHKRSSWSPKSIHNAKFWGSRHVTLTHRLRVK